MKKGQTKNSSHSCHYGWENSDSKKEATAGVGRDYLGAVKVFVTISYPAGTRDKTRGVKIAVKKGAFRCIARIFNRKRGESQGVLKRQKLGGLGAGSKPLRIQHEWARRKF